MRRATYKEGGSTCFKKVFHVSDRRSVTESEIFKFIFAFGLVGGSIYGLEKAMSQLRARGHDRHRSRVGS